MEQLPLALGSGRCRLGFCLGLGPRTGLGISSNSTFLPLTSFVSLLSRCTTACVSAFFGYEKQELGTGRSQPFGDRCPGSRGRHRHTESPVHILSPFVLTFPFFGSLAGKCPTSLQLRSSALGKERNPRDSR